VDEFELLQLLQSGALRNPNLQDLPPPLTRLDEEDQQKLRNVATRALTTPLYPVSALAEALRGAGADLPVEEFVGTQEWAQEKLGGDPYALENLFADVGTPDPFDLGKLAVFGPALARRVRQGDIEVPQSQQWLEDDPNWQVEMADPDQELGGYQDIVHLNVDPVVPSSWRSVPRTGGFGAEDRGRIFYDPRVAELRKLRYGEEDEYYQNIPELNKLYSKRVGFEEDPDKAYRGMKYEEYQNILDRGEVKSNQAMNMGGQTELGTTSWGRDPGTGQIYANDFARLQDKPTPGRPAYVVSTRAENLEAAKGLGHGDDEISALNALPRSQIDEIYEGHPYAITRGEMDWRTDPWVSPRSIDEYREDVFNEYSPLSKSGKWQVGSRSSPSVRTHWKGGTVREQKALQQELRQAGSVPEGSARHEDFLNLANSQRGKPEAAMLRVQKAHGGGVLNPVVEHVGDLTNRMSERYALSSPDRGLEYVKPKIERTLGLLQNPYGFQKEMLENLASNAKYRKVPLKELTAEVDEALAQYAKEHNKLRVYNDVQDAARRAAVAIGEKNWSVAEVWLTKLKRFADDRRTWVREASKHDPHYDDEHQMQLKLMERFKD
jgi:hypothetical protein